MLVSTPFWYHAPAMSVEALWSIEFLALAWKPNPAEYTHEDMATEGAGVVVLETNRVLGGDTSYTYVGDYEVKNKRLTAQVRVRRYTTSIPQSVFGELDDFVVTLEGNVDDSQMSLSGRSPQAPGQWLIARLIRRAELP